MKLIGEIDTNLVKIGSADAFKVSNDIGRIEFNFNQRNFDQPQKFSLTPIDDKTKFDPVNKSLVLLHHRAWTENTTKLTY